MITLLEANCPSRSTPLTTSPRYADSGDSGDIFLVCSSTGNGCDSIGCDFPIALLVLPAAGRHVKL